MAQLVLDRDHPVDVPYRLCQLPAGLVGLRAAGKCQIPSCTVTLGGRESGSALRVITSSVASRQMSASVFMTPAGGTKCHCAGTQRGNLRY